MNEEILIVDDNMDGVWDPGEVATINVDLKPNLLIKKGRSDKKSTSEI